MFKSGILISLNSSSGLIKSNKNLKIKDIINLRTYNNSIFLYTENGKLSIYTQ